MTRDPGAFGTLEALSWRGWVVLRDRVRPSRDSEPFDHLLVGPGGVFVVTRRRWPGLVEIVDGELHLAGRPQPDDIIGLSEAAADALALVPDVPVHPVLCLERHEPFLGWVRNVTVCASSNVEEVLTSRPHVLGPAQVQRAADALGSGLPAVPPVPQPEAEQVTAARGATPWPIRMLLQAVTMATAALLVIAALQAGVVSQLSTLMGDVVTEAATVEEPSTRLVDRSPPSVEPSPIEEPEVKGEQLVRPPCLIVEDDRSEQAKDRKARDRKATDRRARDRRARDRRARDQARSRG